MTRNLIEIYRRWPARRRLQFYAVIFLIFISALAEMLSVGAVVPLLYVLLGNPSIVGAGKLTGHLKDLVAVRDLGPAAIMVLFAVVVIMTGIIRIVANWVLSIFSFVICADIAEDLYSGLLNEDYEWHVNRNSSEIISSIQKVSLVAISVSFQFFQAVSAVFVFIAIFFAMVFLSPIMAISAAFGFGLIYYGVTSLLKRNILANSAVQAEIETRRIREVQEGLGSIRDIIINRNQQLIVKRFAKMEYRLRRVQGTNYFYGAAPRFFIETIVLLAFVGVASIFVDNPAGFVAIAPVLGGLALGAQKLLPQTQQLYSSWAQLGANSRNLEDVLNLLREVAPLGSRTSVAEIIAAPLPPATESTPLIALREVAFAYKGSPTTILEKVNLEIFRGSHVGFVGKTGSGKSTLMDLLLGLLKPSAGIVEINGAPLNDKNRASWQSELAHVPQSIYLADCSIAENIALGIPSDEADPERIREAAAKAQVLEFIERLPNGFDTFVGERGVRLSGGQRQRIGLARALYRRPSVLFFDEATSALDSETEQSVVESVRGLGSEYTIVTIAHRASTLRYCDSIYVVADGTIALSSGGAQAAIIG